jgi:hypothetical protein
MWAIPCTVVLYYGYTERPTQCLQYRYPLWFVVEHYWSGLF